MQSLKPERRVVTMLSADIVGSTQLISGLNPDDALDLLDPVIDTMIESVQLFGGHVLAVEGDGIMVVFGADGEFENHAVRAVLAGQRLQTNLTKLELPARFANPKVRVGIHSGYVIVRSQRGRLDLVGNVGHLCAKIEKAGPANAIAVSETSVNLLSALFKYKKLDSVIEGLDIFEIDIDQNIDALRLLPDSSRQIPLIGRDKELKSIVSNLTSPESIAPYIGVVADAGMGKTRLLSEVFDQITKLGIQTHILKGLSIHADTPFHGLKVFCRNLLGIRRESDADKTQELINQMDPEGNFKLGLQYLLLPHLQEEIASQTRPELILNMIQETTQHLLAQHSGDQRFVILAEDVHFLDRETVTCFEHAAQKLKGAGLSIVFSGRPEARDKISKLSDLLIDLAPLSQKAAQKLVEEIIHNESADRKTDVAKITERSNGLPIALIEFSRNFDGADNGNLDENLPMTLEPLLRRKFDNLSDDERDVIDLISILGSRAKIEFLSSIFKWDEDRIIDILNRLIHSGLLTKIGRGNVEFSHHLYQEVCYNAMPRRVSAAKHKTVFAALTSGASSSGQNRRNHQVLAFHAERSGDPDTALDHLWIASKQAIAVVAIETIRSLYYRAAKICDTISTPESFLRKAKFASRAFIAFQQLALEQELIPIFDEAISREDIGLGSMLEGILHCHISSAKWLSGLPEADKNAKLAMKIALKEHAPMLHARASFLLANSEFLSGKPQQARDRLLDIFTPELEKMFEATSRNSIFLPASQLRIFASWYSIEIGDYAKAKELYLAAREIANQQNHLHSHLICDLSLGYLAYREGRFEDGVSAFSKTYEGCMKHGHYGFAPLVAAWSALCQIEAGQIESAEKTLNIEIQKNKNYLRRKNCWYFYILLAQARLAESRENFESAADFLAQARIHAHNNHDRVHQAYGHYESALFLSRRSGEQDTISEHFTIAKKIAQLCKMQPLTIKIEECNPGNSLTKAG